MVQAIWRYPTRIWGALRKADEQLGQVERRKRAADIARLAQWFMPIALLAVLFNLLSVAHSGVNSAPLFLANTGGFLILPLMVYLGHRGYDRLLFWLPLVIGLPLLILQPLLLGPPYILLALFSLLPVYGTLMLHLRDTAVLSILSPLCLILFHIIAPDAGGLRNLLMWLSVTVMGITLYLFSMLYFVRREAAARDAMLAETRTQAKLDAARLYIENLAHDFRTPLAVIQTSAYIMKRSDDAEKRAEKEALIKKMVLRVQNMLDDTARLTRLQAMISLPLQPIALAPLLDEVLREAKPRLSPHVHLRYELPDAGLTVCASRDLLQTALHELCDNALAYTPEHERITLSVSSSETKTTIRLANTGVSLSSEQIEQLFTPFYRANTARSMDAGRTGLGLTIVQQAMRLQHGTVAVTSTDNQVAATLTLPRYP